MILKLKMSESMSKNIEILKDLHFDKNDKITSGYIIGLIVDDLSIENIQPNNILELTTNKESQEKLKSTSISLRQEVYDKLVDIRSYINEKFNLKLYMAKVIDLLLEIAVKNIEQTDAKKTNLKILNWNINGRTGHGNYVVPVNLLVEEIFLRSPDIFVLTEFVKTLGWNDLKCILEEQYYIFTSPFKPKENGVLIGVKKSADILSANELNVWNNIENENCPNFLEKDLFVNGERIKVIGTRIKVNSQKRKTQEEYDNDFKDRKNQFDCLWNYIKTLNCKVIVAGDFNNGIIGAETQKDYYYKNCSREYYSYQYLWRTVEEWGNKLVTPGRGDKNSFSYVCGDAKIKEDHIVLSENFIVNNLKYDWDFISSKNGYGNLKYDEDKSAVTGMPDHAMLIAEVSLNGEEDLK